MQRIARRPTTPYRTMLPFRFSEFPRLLKISTPCSPSFTVRFVFVSVLCGPVRTICVLGWQALVEELDSKIKALTEKMYQEGNDATTVGKIMKDKEAAEARSAKLYQEVRQEKRENKLHFVVIFIIREVSAAPRCRLP